jgi:hypothetical protein
MSRLMFRLIIHIFILIEVVKGMYVNVTTFSAYGGSNANDNFGQIVSLAMQGDTLIAASVTGYPDPGYVAELFKSIDIGQTWLYIQSIPFATFYQNDMQFFLSETGNELLLGTELYVYTEGKYILSSQSFAISNDYYCQPAPQITSVALSGDGRYVNIAWNCIDNFENQYTYLYIFDIFLGTATKKIELKNGQLYYFPSLMVSNYDGSLIAFTHGLGSRLCIIELSKSLMCEENIYGDDISLTSDGSLVAFGSCGKNVVIYNVTNQTISQTISSPDMTNAYFGCNVDLSCDGIRLVVGSNIKQSNGYAYAYIQVGGLFILETRLNPPLFSLSYGSGGVAVINTLQNQVIVLIGGPQAGIGSSSPSGLIAVYKSVIASVTATPTATSTSSSSSTTTPTSTSSASASASATATSSATSTFSSTSTSSITISPTISTLPSPQSSALAAHAYVFEVTFGIALSGGIVGSMIGCFLYKWIKQRKQNDESQTVSVESINSVNSAGISLLYSS